MMVTKEKVPVRLVLEALPARACLIYSMRHYFSAGVNHPKQHPLMHQIGSNPDCNALGITAGGHLVAHCFFHYQKNTREQKKVLVHSFMVHPHLRGRGLGSLLQLHFLRSTLSIPPTEIEIG